MVNVLKHPVKQSSHTCWSAYCFRKLVTSITAIIPTVHSECELHLSPELPHIGAKNILHCFLMLLIYVSDLVRNTSKNPGTKEYEVGALTIL